MSVTIELTNAEADTLRYLLSVHTDIGIPRYSWTKRNRQQAERMVTKLAIAMKREEVKG